MTKHDYVLHTISMFEEQQLDIRTITMGISLMDCIDADGEKARKKIYQKITQKAAHLVDVAEEIERTYGIPITNKRISVTPIALVAGACQDEDFVAFAHTLDLAAKAVGVDYIGGFSALVQKGFTSGDQRLLASIPQALAQTDKVCASVNIASTKAGINLDAVKWMGEIIRQTAELTAAAHGMGCGKLVVFANSVSDNPFMAGAYHGIEEADCVIHVGISGPGVVKQAIEEVQGESIDIVAETIKKAAFRITRMGQLVGAVASEKLGVPFGIVDLSLAPTPAIGDSVGEILEEMGVEIVGTHGTTAALAVLNDAVKKGGMMACSQVGGLSGSFIPVSEDHRMIDAAAKGQITIDKLEAMTAICSVGLDMIAVPGDTPATTLAAIIADEAAIGVQNHKTTAVRVIPAIGLDVGERVELGGLLGSAPVMPVHGAGAQTLINRGGQIPAPVHSFKN